MKRRVRHEVLCWLRDAVQASHPRRRRLTRHRRDTLHDTDFYFHLWVKKNCLISDHNVSGALNQRINRKKYQLVACNFFAITYRLDWKPSAQAQFARGYQRRGAKRRASSCGEHVSVPRFLLMWQAKKAAVINLSA